MDAFLEAFVRHSTDSDEIFAVRFLHVDPQRWGFEGGKHVNYEVSKEKLTFLDGL
jgi:hypothetical protein